MTTLSQIYGLALQSLINGDLSSADKYIAQARAGLRPSEPAPSATKVPAPIDDAEFTAAELDVTVAKKLLVDATTKRSLVLSRIRDARGPGPFLDNDGRPVWIIRRGEVCFLREAQVERESTSKVPLPRAK